MLAKIHYLSASHVYKMEIHGLENKNYLNSIPLTIWGCKTRVTDSVFRDGKCKINSECIKIKFYLWNREISTVLNEKLN